MLRESKKEEFQSTSQTPHLTKEGLQPGLSYAMTGGLPHHVPQPCRCIPEGSQATASRMRKWPEVRKRGASGKQFPSNGLQLWRQEHMPALNEDAMVQMPVGMLDLTLSSERLEVVNKSVIWAFTPLVAISCAEFQPLPKQCRQGPGTDWPRLASVHSPDINRALETTLYKTLMRSHLL